MRYTEEIEINLPRDEVVRIFMDQDAMAEWQLGLQSVELLSGEPWQAGTRTRLVFLTGRRRMEMVETVVSNDLPESFHATYDAKGVHNVCENHLHEAGPGRTRWVTANLFEFSGPMKVVGLLFRGSFPKETRAQMARFKAFAESAEAARD
ncbi:SRPBCC family protein [Georgenia sp. SYP-B2076]|uniref:SRPBCC family protein n=1 Tax=Georgenia sp. SYP-B2076 TaxID=2495881 RepID=UPI000F8D0F00|nr:SRPBCC family protein [Georgenia sp. SYP-B2076]